MALKGKKVLALIPARGGSKGIEKKNIFPIADKFLIDYTIDAASNSSYVDEVFISSDSQEILNYAKNMKLKILHRPKEFATDNSSAIDVVNHFYKELFTKGYDDTQEDFYLTYLQPTSPLRTSKILDESFELLAESKETSLISLTKNKYSPYKSFTLDKKQRAESLFEESKTNECRQNLQSTYRANGAIYTFLISQFLSNKGFPSNKSRAFIMSNQNSLDIDTMEDIDLLKSILTENK